MGRRVRPYQQNKFGTKIKSSKFILMILFLEMRPFLISLYVKKRCQKMNNPLSRLLQESENLNINGLLFQHIVLCPTRTWLHYHVLVSH